MPQTLIPNLFLYANDSCLVYQYRDAEEIEKQLKQDFENVYDRFFDNKLSIQFEEDKFISIFQVSVK